VVFPQTEIGPDVGAVRAYGQCADQLGYHHVLRSTTWSALNPAIHRGWKGPCHVRTQLHEPFVRCGFLAGNTSLHFTTGVLILPQRETVLVAEQAAELDLPSDRRLRLGVGVGWNPVEYVALGQDFAVRGAAWTSRSTSLLSSGLSRRSPTRVASTRSTEPACGPLPTQRPTPLWLGGGSAPDCRRTARLADGWFPVMAPGPELAAAAAAVADPATAAGRDPAALGMEGRPNWHGDPDDLAEQAMRWRRAGATHVWLNTMNAAVATPDEHLAALASAAEVLFGS